jgi:predicted ATP-binding protein involved in virulence
MSILGLDNVQVEYTGRVYVEHREFGRVRFDELGDGYLATAGWIVDLMARWVGRQAELGGQVGENFIEQMCGIVLLDGIDLHLHPGWQRRIIEDVRRLFPRMSFIATTHNALTLQGARSGEAYVMVRKGVTTKIEPVRE